MRPTLLALFPFALAAVATPAAAQVQDDAQLWLVIVAQKQVAPRINLWLEGQPRFNDDVSRPDQLLLRPLVSYSVTPRLSLGQGYVHVLLPNDDGPDRHEHRSLQQLAVAAGRVGPGELSLRTRLEQRFVSNGADTGWRLRQQGRYRVPLHPGRRGVAALGWAEGFVALNTTDWGARRGFDQLRLFGGIEAPIAGKSTVEAGYMAQVLDRPGPATRLGHTLHLSLYLR